MTTMQLIGAILFGCALAHTLSAKYAQVPARRHPRHAALRYLQGEVEVVFGFWDKFNRIAPTRLRCINRYNALPPNLVQ